MRDPGFVDVFNREADIYDERHGATCGIAHRLALEAVTARGAEPSHIVDIGCGTGALLEAAARHWPGARLSGVDPADRMIGVAGAQLSGAALHVATAERLPFPDRCADLVLSTTSFNHWSDQRAGLAEAARVVTPAGLVVVVEHAPPDPATAVLLTLAGRMVRHHTEHDITEMAWDAGLAPLSVTTEAGGFLRLIAQPTATALWKEPS
ncbi:putative methyltransferase [Actinoplanes missouriensis 431]|uniref:Putative methyltransferase n=1 Tax=Actinoplanes missouriensis (strain ATCC 14538 / DSM 43046 / CBS 188.64 / JCM 3121 / NBRC 102363 / NCIMB 12654 / NRRL B-3342 / UNCC 431) TaxID=512565 RepID=I0H608_ACTM4|nr:class I SAM-dependent methyltransferase [Actinoplanes missouriensis]BAL88445.1 putative methyltransferase [Actinoplanes missouriensis 431]